MDVTAFSNITGQMVQSKILEAYTQEAFVLSKLVDTIPTRLDGERIPGIGRISDEVAEVRPGMPYPSLGFAEDYIETPQTTKRGFIVPVTKEAIFFDRTHLILQRAAEVGEVLGLNKEKRLLDLLIGATNNYKWKGANYNTYSNAGTGRPGRQLAERDDRRTGRLDRRRRRRAAVCQHSRPEHRRAGADPGDHRAGDAGVSSRGASDLQRRGDRLRRIRPIDDHVAANPLGNYTVVGEPAGLPANHGRRLRPPTTPRSGGSSATSARRSPTWRIGRSP